MDEWLLHFFNQTLARPWLDGFMLAVSVVGLAACPALGVALAWGPNPPASLSASLPALGATAAPVADGRVQAFPGREGGAFNAKDWFSPTSIAGQSKAVGRAVLGALAAGLVVVLAMQYVVLRPRPEGVRVVAAVPNFPSFPSGHAMAGFATATVLALAARRGRVAAPAYAGAALLAASRVYLGHHFPSDVFAGAVIGAGVGAAAYGVWAAGERGAARWRWLLWPQVALMVVVSQLAYMGGLPLRLLRLPYTDKVLHFLLFGSLAFWLSLWLRPRRLAGVPLAVAVPAAVALAEEGAQALSRQRSAGLDDLAADLVGMVLFWWLGQRIERIEQSKAETAKRSLDEGQADPPRADRSHQPVLAADQVPPVPAAGAGDAGGLPATRR